MIRIMANFVSKLPNFRYHGYKERLYKIPTSLLRIFSTSHVETLPGSMHAKFNVRAFSNFGDLDS